MKKIIFLVIIILNVWLLKSQTFTVYPDKGGIIRTDTSGNIWVARNGDLYKFDGINWVNYDSTTCINFNNSTRFMIDKSNNIWYYYLSLIYKFDGNSCSLVIDLFDDMTTPSVKRVIQDKLGNVWAAVEYQGGSYTGVSLYKYDGNTFVSVSAGAWPASFQSIATDSAGNIWLSFYYLYYNYFSVLKYDGATSTEFNYTNSCLPSSLSILGIDKYNKLWYAGSGFYKFDEVNCDAISINTVCRDSGDGSYNIAFVSYKGNIAFWQSTTGKLAIYDEPNCIVFDTSNSDIISDKLYNMIIDKYGNLWASTFDGNNYIDLVKVCGLIDTCFTVTSPKLQAPSPKLQIYPNPTGNNIKIRLPAGSKEPDVSIYNISGSEVFKEQFKSNEIEINTENFSKGVYLLKVSYGNEVFNERVVIN